MIKNWFVTGDTHGKVKERVAEILHENPKCNPTETAIIILGDAGINYYQNETEKNKKKDLHRFGCQIYCVRGNHEERPENLLNIVSVYDSNVDGEVYVEQGAPLIKYFKDGGEYHIMGYSVLTIGGAYSVDKDYRLSRAALMGSSFTGWFPDEQLTIGERKNILSKIKGQHYNFILTHTCPEELEPTDLFLPMIDQSKVDKTMEKWLSKVRKAISYDIWAWGHFHDDRKVTPKNHMFYTSYKRLEKLLPKSKRIN